MKIAPFWCEEMSPNICFSLQKITSNHLVKKVEGERGGVSLAPLCYVVMNCSLIKSKKRKRKKRGDDEQSDYFPHCSASHQTKSTSLFNRSVQLSMIPGEKGENKHLVCGWKSQVTGFIHSFLHPFINPHSFGAKRKTKSSC